MRLAALGLFTALAPGLWSCRPTPESLAERVRVAFEAGDLRALEAILHPSYADPLGDRAKTMTGLAELFEAFPGRELSFEALELRREASLVLTGVQHLSLAGNHTVKLVAPLRWELEPSVASFTVRSGFFDQLRDIELLLAARRAALEANDPEAYGRLLHPEYRDGDLNRTQVLARLTEDVEGAVLRLQPVHHQIEVRADLAHVDERYELRIGEQAFPRGLARLTLRSSLGRWQISGGLYAP